MVILYRNHIHTCGEVIHRKLVQFALHRQAAQHAAVHVGDPPVEELVQPGAAPADSGYVVPGEDLQFWLYRLRPLTPGETLAGKAVLCFSDDTIPDDMKHWLIDNCGIVNSMLFSPETSHICYGFPGADLTADMLLEMEKASNGGLFFRIVSD